MIHLKCHSKPLAKTMHSILPNCFKLLAVIYSYSLASYSFPTPMLNKICSVSQVTGALWDPKENLSERRTLDARDGPGYRRLQTQTQGTKNALSGRYREDVRWQVNEARWCGVMGREGGLGHTIYHNAYIRKKQPTILCLPAPCDALRSKQGHTWICVQ